jgi:uncharacterized protein (DUF433 family)
LTHSPSIGILKVTLTEDAYGGVMRFQDVARYWSKVRVLGDDECWEWQGRTTNNGYGYFFVDGLTRYAHRVSYMLSNGLSEPPPSDLIILHLCDNRLCQNPRHLRGGTQLENMQDKVAKGRHRFGNVRLTEAKVRDIALLYSTGTISAQAIADQYGVSKTAITGVLTGRTWKHVTRVDTSITAAERKRGETKAHRGEAAGRKKLTEAMVREIVSLALTEGWTATELAAKYGVDRTNISCILRGKTWTHLKLELPDPDSVSDRTGDRHWTKRKKSP